LGIGTTIADSFPCWVIPIRVNLTSQYIQRVLLIWGSNQETKIATRLLLDNA